MDVHGAGVVAVLGTVGAATGAISAVIVYTICARRRRLPLLPTGGGPLNWFERDLLDRAEEAARSSKDVLVGLGSGVALGRENKTPKHSDSRSDDEEWQSDHVFDSIASDSPRRVLQHLSESDDIPVSPMSPLAPPLPEGAVVASEKRMVIVKPPTRSIDGTHSRLSSAEIDTPRHKLSSSSSTSSSDESRGELQLGLIYDAPAGILTVMLIEAHELRARELSGTADPYAKIRLLPDRSNVWQTRIHKRTLNPVFDEYFIFEVAPESSLTGRTLEVLLYDFDAFSRHRGLGYVQLPLSSISETLGTTLTVVTKPVLRYGAEGGFRAPPLGELMVSLSYQPSMEKLTVIIVRARNLPIPDEPSTANPYVKVALAQDGKNLKKKKSGIQRDATSPVWNDILSFDVNSDLLSKCSLKFSVLRASGELLARCEVSSKCQKELFHRVLSGKGASAQWLPLSEPETQLGDSTEHKN
ncbi:hypothetical protein KM043_007538 [Ampulex compressa]|nr:hypothetical protein KM043_007538 [Ampulex compressa]